MGTWRALEDAYRHDKMRSLGISNFDNLPGAFQQVVNKAQVKPQIMQIGCHPYAQRHQTQQLASQYDMQVYFLGHADPALLGNDTLADIAQEYNKSVVQTILRWHLQGGASPPSLGSRIPTTSRSVSTSLTSSSPAMTWRASGRWTGEGEVGTSTSTIALLASSSCR